MNPKVDAFIGRAKSWKSEYETLRQIALSCDLTEDLKWGVPCYTYEDKNIVLIHGFKEYCAVLFFKGVLLKDPRHLLVTQTENVQAARQMRFTSVADVDKMAGALKSFILAAIEIEQSGLKVTLKETSEFGVPEEFRTRLNKSPGLKKAFEALTPGRQRGYLLHFSSAKLAKTRESRIEKCVPQILDGKGLDDL